jgi:hypothetical protein
MGELAGSIYKLQVFQENTLVVVLETLLTPWQLTWCNMPEDVSCYHYL